MKRYVINVLIGVDQLITTLVGGWPDESLSSYAYRMNVKGRLWGQLWAPFIDMLFSDGHCRRAWEAERLRTQVPLELR